jgi:RNA polymerase sigma factor (TIGR02999 family)
MLMSDLTHILDRAQRGDPQAAEELLPLVYDELRRLAARKMANEPPGQTLQPTALVHEAWLRLTKEPGLRWNGRQHFFRAAPEAMRRILVDRARQRACAKRGHDPSHTELSDSKLEAVAPDDQILAVHAALDELARRDPASAELVKLRFFVGLNMAEAAESLGLPLRTAGRRWTFAKTWLRAEIQGSSVR